MKWAEENKLDHTFHDFRKVPVSGELINTWEKSVGRERLVNKRGTTYKKLSEADKAALEQDSPYELLSKEPTIMKRPVFQMEGKVEVGFTDAERAAVLNWVK